MAARRLSHWPCGTALALLGIAWTFSAFAATDAQYAAGSTNDPRLREARFLADEGRLLSAVATLLQRRDELAGQPTPPALQRRLAEVALAFGLPEWAERDDRAETATGQQQQEWTQTRLRLATFLYDHGDAAEAIAVLDALRPYLRSSGIAAWQDLLSRAQLARGQTAAAIRTLTDPEDAPGQTAYQQYNLGVALLADGQSQAGAEALDRVGRMTPVDSDTLALRDKANLVLGYHYLQRKHPATAIEVFTRIRLRGPFSNRALLGLGWAELANRAATHEPAADANDAGTAAEHFSTIGAIFRPGFLDDILLRDARLRALSAQGIANADQARFKRALVPWAELLSRDPMDPAVQEGLLAVPYALERLGAHAEARDYYRRAVAAFQATRENLDRAMANVRGGRMLYTIIARDQDAESGWSWRLTDLPDAPETFYLQSLLAGHPYQVALKNYRDLRLLQRSLQVWDQQLAQLQQRFGDLPRVEIPVGALIERARRENPEAYTLTPPPVKLRWAQRLSTAASAPAAQAVTSSAPPVRLTLAPSPTRFDGDWERLTALRARIAALQPQMAEAEAQARQHLDALAIRELEQQKRIADGYLAQARLALARIYDRRAGSGGPP